MSNLKRTAVVCFILGSLAILNACGTVHGFGRDVSNVGHGIQKAVN